MGHVAATVSAPNHLLMQWRCISCKGALPAAEKDITSRRRRTVTHTAKNVMMEVRPRSRLMDSKHNEHDTHDHDTHDHDHHEHVPVPYRDAVEGFREDKDDFFRTHPNSPVPEAERAGFTGLPYFPVDEDLVFDGVPLEPYIGDEPAAFQIQTSDDRLRAAYRAGILRFEIADQPLQLTAYTFDGVESRNLFVPFLDGTSGTETYGAGRYLDLEPEDDGTYTLDFNLAYHPSCVYDPRFSCPLTPAENRLPVRVEAGERLAEGHA